jgi:hypothetical protein
VTEGERRVEISGGQGVVVGDYATVFQTFTTAPAPLSSHIRVAEFSGTIEDRTRSFTGREYVFAALDAILRDRAFPSGYVLLQGEPGIGKTTVLAQLVKTRGYVHHLNIAPLGIRSAQAFLANTCAQLITRYGLDHTFLPETATLDGGFLSRLLAEAAADPANLPLVVVVDALDEAEDGGSDGANRLFLPPSLPTGVHIVASTREQFDYRLQVDARRDLYLRDDDPRNIQDVRAFVLRYLQEHADHIGPDPGLADVLVDRSEGNFMYVVHVLRDLVHGEIDTAEAETLPHGLRAYYRRHWTKMRARDPELFDRYQEPAICLLATAREPVDTAQVIEWTRRHWTDRGWGPTAFRPRAVLDVLRGWREFLNAEGSAYRIYHASFQDFLAEEIGLILYHDIIVGNAVEKIPGFDAED